MAVSKILHMKDCGKSFHGKHLKAAIEYITALEKTQNGRLVSAVNCQPGFAFEQMKATKKKFGKQDKRQAYHIILSFKEGETDPDTVFELTQKFVSEYLAKDYEVIFAVHDNTAHPHSHIIFNSVSFRDGKKYHYRKGDWERYIQPVTNRLCKEYGLSTIEPEDEAGKRKVKSGRDWNNCRDGKFVWADMVKRDIEACILQAASYKSFISMLGDKGYEIKNAECNDRFLSIKPKGIAKYVSLKLLGHEYEKDSLVQRIMSENISSDKEEHKEEIKPKIIYCRVRRYKRAGLSGLQKKYYSRLYRTGKLKKKAYSVAWKDRDEIKKMHRMQEQYLFLVRHDIHSVAGLEQVTENLIEIRKSASAQKSKVYRTSYKNKELYEIVDKMDELVECENCYRNGDTFFVEEHEKWIMSETQLRQKGYSYDEVKELKEHYHCQAVKFKNMETMAAKEIRIADSIAEEIKTQQIKMMEEKIDRQPERQAVFLTEKQGR